MSIISSNLGFPRIGAKRELKKAVESFWAGETKLADLESAAKEIRATNWKLQKEAGINHIPSNDFSYYDQTLDTIAMVGAVPSRYKWDGGKVDADTYFAMARGGRSGKLDGVPAMEMTKWFDTNYHYIVPEFSAGQNFKLSSTKAVDEFLEAKALGIVTRPVLVGPVTFLLLGKAKDGSAPLDLLDNLLPVYSEILAKLKEAGAEWVQIDEPALVLDLDDKSRAAFGKAYAALAKSGLKILVATYFAGLGSNLETALALPVAALHLDAVRGESCLEAAISKAPGSLALSIGVVEGRNIWKTDLAAALDKLERAVAKLGKERVIVAPSCSLLHSPVDLAHETKLDSELKSWLAFARQKVEEVAVLAKALAEGRASVAEQLKENKKALDERKVSKRIHSDEVKKRITAIDAGMKNRKSPYKARAGAQAKALGLPLLPTTTIGSFPQTKEVREARANFKNGRISAADYDKFLKEETAKAMRYQDEIGMDVPVHGEFERNDMVEYFGEQLSGFAFTQNGWVQSYGSRCVKPPVIFGDVSRPKPMTVEWSAYAQSLTKKPVKGMLTGPVTILQWSFVRDDQPRSATCNQIALAIRDEVQDLEKAGIKVIQIDEPAIREGLPLRRSEWRNYLDWAVGAFRISASGVKDETQIHTHMCYSEFNDIIESIAAMDADVISIETSRSQMELLDAFTGFKYPNEIGPGVYDIHSPIVPTEQQMTDLLKKALKVLSPEQVWVNPDCGLKTRGWKEVKPALEAMIASAKKLRGELGEKRKTA